jgi:hypothetical protein
MPKPVKCDIRGLRSDCSSAKLILARDRSLIDVCDWSPLEHLETRRRADEFYNLK